MTDATAAPPSALAPEDHKQVTRITLFLSLVYVVEGLGQMQGLIAQPLNYYLKEVHGWTPVQVTSYLAVFSLPWVIKPIYGLISDFVPLFGYRRKSYLIASNAVATGAYLTAAYLTSPGPLGFVLLLTAYAMAISSTLCGGVLVENGQKFDTSAKFVNSQWLWYNVASMLAAIAGGQLIEWLSPTSALHAAAFIVALAPLVAIFGTIFLVSEEKRPINIEQLKSGFASLIAAVKQRQIWIVAVFLFLYYFSPGFATPLYYHMTDNLKFSQGYIGILTSINAAGWVVGALLYSRFGSRISLRKLIYASIAAGVVSSASFLMLAGQTSAALLNLCNGFSTMLATLVTLTLAAEFCPKNSEGFSYAILMSVTHVTAPLSDIAGSYLYERVFEKELAPLILVSSAFTAIAFVLVPLLRLGKRCRPSAQVCAYGTLSYCRH